MKSYVAAVFAAFSVIGAQDLASAQSGNPSIPKFEVASIKECEVGVKVQPPSSVASAGRLRLGCWPLGLLISDAYETFANGKVDPLKPPKAPPLEGTPDWANSTPYTIDAKAEGQPSGAMMRGPMMQALLADRFRVQVHREAREISGYVMTVDKGGLKLKPSQEGSCDRIDPTDPGQSEPKKPCSVPMMSSNGLVRMLDLPGVTLDVFAQVLRPDGRPVINQTGVTGVFDIHLEWETAAASSPDTDSGVGSAPAPRASQIEEMRRQLGLRLEPGKGTRELLVLDHVEKPTAN